MTLPTVAVFVMPGFSPFHVSTPAIVFSDILPDTPLFRLIFCAEQPGTVRSAQGISIDAPGGLAQLEQADIIIIPYWPHPQQRPSAALVEALHNAHRRNAQLVGMCLGTWALAWAGLLDGRRAATHWECEADFTRTFPSVCLDTNALYVDDGGIVTSAGTAAGIDCSLYLVRQHYGSAVANRIARRMVSPPHREGGQAQFIERPLAQTTQDARINALLAHLRQHLHEPQSLDALAARVSMSRRTFTRHFQRATGMSVGDWLLAERLQRSQQLLEESRHGVEAVAQACGFASPVTFRQQFKTRYGVSPSEWRRTFCGSRNAP